MIGAKAFFKENSRIYRIDHVSVTHYLRPASIMFLEKWKNICFEFSDPSVQAVVNKVPTAKIIEHLCGWKQLIEAKVYGTIIKIWLLSQCAWTKVLSPIDLVDKIKEDIRVLNALYSN